MGHSCKCKRRGCSTCGKCPRCHCRCDGVRLSEKRKRKRGRPKKEERETERQEAIETPLNARGAKKRALVGIVSTRAPPAQLEDQRQLALSTLEASESLERSVVLREFLSSMMRLLGSHEAGDITRIREPLRKEEHLEEFGNWSDARRAALLRVSKKLIELLLECVAPDIVHSSARVIAEIGEILARLDRSHLGMQRKSRRYEKIAHRLAVIIDGQPPSSIERRTALAVMAGVTPKALTESMITLRGDTRANFSTDRWRQNANSDFLAMESGQSLARNVVSRERVAKGVVEIAVADILSAKNVQYLNSKVRRIKCEGEWVKIPSLDRKRSRTKMFESYCQDCSGKRLKRSSYLALASLLTGKDMQAHSGVDDVLWVYGEYNRDVVERLVNYIGERTPGSADWVESTKKRITAVDEFLKKDYKTRHVEVSSKPSTHLAASHAALYALDKDGSLPDGYPFPTSSCVECYAPFKLLQDISDRAGVLEDAVNNVICNRIIPGCRTAYRILMGHLLRARVQRNRTTDMIVKVAKSNGSTILIIMDFKMKLLAKAFSEAQPHWFGKTGTSCHGMAILFLKSGIDESTFDFSCSKTVKEAMATGAFNIHYIFQVVASNKPQEAPLVAGLVEVGLRYIKEHKEIFGDVNSVILQSDNAPNYANKKLSLILWVIGKIVGIDVITYLHNEPGDGKTILDAIFGLITSLLNVHVKFGRNAVTFAQVATALRGLQNSTVMICSYPPRINGIPVPDLNQTPEIDPDGQLEAVSLVEEAYGPDTIDALSVLGIKRRDNVTAAEDLLLEEIASEANYHLSSITTVREVQYFSDHLILYRHSNDERSARKVRYAAMTRFSELLSKCSSLKSVCDLRGSVTSCSHVEYVSRRRQRELKKAQRREKQEASAAVAAASDEPQALDNQCPTCHQFFALLKNHRCKGAQKKEAKDVISVGIKAGLEVIFSKWTLVDDISIRMVIEDSHLGSPPSSEQMLAWFGSGWADHPRNRTTTKGVQAEVHRICDDYLIYGRKPKGHMVFEELQESTDEHGLPLIMPTELPGLSTVVNLAKKYEREFNKRLEEKSGEKAQSTQQNAGDCDSEEEDEEENYDIENEGLESYEENFIATEPMLARSIIPGIMHISPFGFQSQPAPQLPNMTQPGFAPIMQRYSHSQPPGPVQPATHVPAMPISMPMPHPAPQRPLPQNTSSTNPCIPFNHPADYYRRL